MKESLPLNFFSFTANHTANSEFIECTGNQTVHIGGLDCALYSVVNLEGQYVKKGMITKDSNELDLNNIPDGMFLIQFETPQETLYKRLIKY